MAHRRLDASTELTSEAFVARRLIVDLCVALGVRSTGTAVASPAAGDVAPSSAALAARSVIDVPGAITKEMSPDGR